MSQPVGSFILCVCLTKSEPFLNGTNPPPLRSGGTLGRGGIPPTPPFRRALASGISAKKSGG